MIDDALITRVFENIINNGELVEQGTHDELLSNNESQYKYLYELQFKGNIN